MGNAMTPEKRALWLMLARHGGWWTTKSLTHHWSPTFPDWEMQDMLDGLVAGGYVAARDMMPQDSKPSYCVTSECVPLPGYVYAGKGDWKEAA